jgi:hypothetical protein
MPRKPTSFHLPPDLEERLRLWSASAHRSPWSVLCEAVSSHVAEDPPPLVCLVLHGLRIPLKLSGVSMAEPLGDRLFLGPQELDRELYLRLRDEHGATLEAWTEDPEEFLTRILGEL